MKFSVGKMKRVFALTFEHGDLLHDLLAEFVRKEDIRNGYIFFLGALESGRVVTGPEDLTLPTKPMWGEFADGREVIGMGTVAWDNGTPRVHLHTSAGRGGEQLLGCLRDGGRVHIVIEAVIFEVAFKALTKKYDERTGAHLPEHGWW